VHLLLAAPGRPAAPGLLPPERQLAGLTPECQLTPECYLAGPTPERQLAGRLVALGRHHVLDLSRQLAGLLDAQAGESCWLSPMALAAQQLASWPAAVAAPAT
jgi:hypothetical protein